MRTTKNQKVDLKSNGETNPYNVAASSMSVKDKLKVLEDMGRPDLIEVFKEWQPRQVKSRRRTAPLDHRVAITVTDRERMELLHDIEETNKLGTRTTVSSFVRNRALGSVDIQQWREIAEITLNELNEIDSNHSEIAKEKRKLSMQLEEEDDPEELGLMERRMAALNLKLRRVVAQNEKRGHRLSGRMSMAEAETIKWRASRLCISTSDYLRFVIFNHLPDSYADAHLSLDAKRRFYISIVDVALNGWGEPPTIAHCPQCQNYIEEIRRLKDRVQQLETYV